MTIQDGAHESPQRQFDSPGEGRFLYITSKNIRNNFLDLKKVSYVEADFHNRIYPRCKPNVGDVLLTKDGANTGNVTINTLDEPFSLLSSVCLIKTKPDVLHSGFLSYFIQSPEGLQSILGQMTGAAIKRIILRDIKLAVIPLPPLSEQQRIVGILDEAFEGIATAKANAGKNLQSARALFESHLQSVFAQRESGWVEKRLEEIGTTQTGSTPKTSDRANYGNFIPFIKPADFNANGSLDYENDGLSEKGLMEARNIAVNSVLMVCIGATIGKCGYCDRDIVTNQQINAFTPFKDIFHKFVYYQMLTENFQRRMLLSSAQATLPIINKSKWSALTVVFPPKLEDQKRIATKFDTLCEETQRLASIYKRKLTALEELKKSLLHQAFSGQL
ncbi:MAG: restriction endonuclease subunit S [Verrucomicrobia bacterium]|nr:restriction endonuclease subunit S [Verrucomicrobiota bacterium]